MRIWFLNDGTYKKDLDSVMSQGGTAGMESVVVDDVSYIVDGQSTELFVAGKPVQPPTVFFYSGALTPQAEALCKRLESIGSLCYNSIEAKRISISKIATNEALAKAGVPFVATIPVTNGLEPEFLVEKLGLPLVIKPDDGHAGIGVCLVNTKDELANKLVEIAESDGFFIAQSFIKTSFGRDVRVLMLGHKPIYAALRKSDNDKEFRSNVSLGGHLEDVELTEEDYAMCEKASRAIGLNYCGLDLLYGENGFLIGEVNSSPGFKAWYEKANLMEHLKNDLAKRLRGV